MTKLLKLAFPLKIHFFRHILAGVILTVVATLSLTNACFAQIISTASEDSVHLFTSPREATFEEGSFFELPVYINTNGKSVSTIHLKLEFNPSELSIVEKSGNTSIIGAWIKAPEYSNTKGYIELAGSIPNGIVTEGGLIIKLKFKTLLSGETSVIFSTETKVYLNDENGTEAKVFFDRNSFTVLAKAPAGLSIYSDTHPFQDKWYNDNNPVLGWGTPQGISVFSFTLDDKPLTVPLNSPSTTTNHASFESLGDGLKYFHLKSQKNGVWGATTHFLMRIDTTPPRDFKPRIEILSATIISKTLVFFESTDALSGIDRYEVGVLDREKPDSSPLFVVSQSPFEMPSGVSGSMRIIVRAFDKAGNAKDSTIDVAVSQSLLYFFKDNLLLVLLILLVLLHFLFGHRIGHHIKRIFKFTKDEFKNDEKNDPNSGPSTQP